MKRFLMSVAGMTCLVFLTDGPASACGRPSCGAGRVAAVPIARPGPTGQVAVRNGADADESETIDNPAEEADDSGKLRLSRSAAIRSAAPAPVSPGRSTSRRSRNQATCKDTQRPAPTPAPAGAAGDDGSRGPVRGGPGTAPAGESWNERVVKAVQLQQAQAAQNARLEAKKAELERWDAPAQEKFRRAFGTADEAVRQRVLERIGALIQRNQQTIAAIADGMNFEFYLTANKCQ
jgi:hypothetical protein